MKRRDLVLALLSASDGRPYTPVQIQKALFLINQNTPEAISNGPRYNFVPYDYGPFDSTVYEDLRALAHEGQAVIAPSGFGNWNTYAVSDQGLARGKELLEHASPRVRKYVVEISRWVRAQTFAGLLRSIYHDHPAMKANSIFRG